MGRMAKKARGEHTPKIYWSVGQNLVKFDGSANLLVARRGSYICPRLYLPVFAQEYLPFCGLPIRYIQSKSYIFQDY
jgi:hypothetical protein